MRRRDLHRPIDNPGAGVKRAAEDAGKSQDIVDLIGKIAAPGANDRRTGGQRDIGHDLWLGIGHCQDDRSLGHALDIAGSEQAALADPDKDIRPLQHLVHAAGMRGLVGIGQ